MNATQLDLSYVRKILILGAHADDIEIGCGGTLLRMLASQPRVEARWHVFSAPGARRTEARRSAVEFLRAANASRIQINGFRESYFPEKWGSIKESFEGIAKRYDPDLIFTHWREDRHQDHRVLSDLTWNAFRNHTILEYEIPKYDGDVGQPNFYVALDEGACRRKIDFIMRHFHSQAEKHWFSEDTFWAMLRLRGIECGGGTRYAEAFHARKLVV